MLIFQQQLIVIVIVVALCAITLCQPIERDTIKKYIKAQHKNIVSLIKQQEASENG